MIGVTAATILRNNMKCSWVVPSSGGTRFRVFSILVITYALLALTLLSIYDLSGFWGFGVLGFWGM